MHKIAAEYPERIADKDGGDLVATHYVPVCPEATSSPKRLKIHKGLAFAVKLD